MNGQIVINVLVAVIATVITGVGTAILTWQTAKNELYSNIIYKHRKRKALG